MASQAIQQEALSRATSSQSTTNYGTIFAEFEAQGIPAEDIKPRENVFTFNAWKALGRCVKKGEHGVKVITFLESSRIERDKETGEEKRVGSKRPWTTTVFHISQTKPINETAQPKPEFKLTPEAPKPTMPDPIQQPTERNTPSWTLVSWTESGN